MRKEMYSIIDDAACAIEEGLTIEEAVALALHHVRCGRVVGVQFRLDDGSIMYLNPDRSQYWWGDMWSEESLNIKGSVH